MKNPTRFSKPLAWVMLSLIGSATLVYSQSNPIAVSFRASEINALNATDNAGLFAQQNWNDINLGPEGGLNTNPIFSPLALKDSTGAATGITIQTTHTTGYAANRQPLSGVTPDFMMMAGALYLRQADSGEIQITNIPTSLQTETYDLIVYYDALNSRDISATLNGQTIEGDDDSNFNGTFTEATGANVDGDYIRFRNLSAATLNLKIGVVSSTQRAGLTGIQIVPATAIPPEIVSFSSTPATVTSPTDTISLSWNVTGATSVSINQSVGTVAASGSTTVSPGGDKTYTITATNAAGTTTQDFSVYLVNSNVPNIVIFIVDDFGWQDTSYEFWDNQTQWNQLYKTPGMERLGTNGRAFTSAYASGPVCTASRVSIMLGQAPVRHGTTFITGTRGNDTAQIRSADQDNAGLVGEEQTRSLPHLLSVRGYRAINVGKAHFGPANPLEVGFDRNRYGGPNGGPNGNGPNVYQQILPDTSQVHLSEALTLAANEEIDDAVTDGVPFFLYMSHYAVHTPILEDARFSGNYPTVTGTTRAMCTLIEGMDKSLNDLLNHLEAKGIAEKTLIIFTSDHGGLSYRGGSTFYDDPPAPNRKFNWPLRGGKNDAYEGGLRIPMFVSWAKNDPTEPLQQALPIPAGTKESRPVIHADLLPTILEITGYSAAIPDVVDGKNFSGYITGDTNFTRENKFFWHAPNYWIGTQAQPDSAMRDGKYKIIYTYNTTGGIWELFDLEADIGETTNLMNTQPEIGVRMARELIQYLESENANYPVLIATGQELAPVLPAQAAQVDLDNDGLNDSQEDTNLNGLVDPGETDPDKQNTDEDNVNDGDELSLGLDPLDATSFFFLLPSRLTNGDFQITWPSSSGNTFTILSSTDLNDWSNIVDTGIAAASGSTTSYNLGSPSPNTDRFFRVELE